MWWTVDHLPWRGEKVVPVAFYEAVVSGAGHRAQRFLQHGGLFAAVVHLGQQPQPIIVLAGMLADRQEMTRHQVWLIAVAASLQVVGAMTFEGVEGQLLAPRAFGEEPRIAIILQCRPRCVAVEPLGRLQQKAALAKVMITARGRRGAGFYPYLPLLDRRRFGHHAAVLAIGCGTLQTRKNRLIVAQHQQVFFPAVLEVVVNAFFLTQALDEVQIGFRLDAVFARRIVGAEMKLVQVTLNTVVRENPGNDLWHAHLLENSLVETVLQIRNAWNQCQAVASQAFAAITPGNAIDYAVDAMTFEVECQERLLVHEAFQTQVRSFADQLDLERVGLADGFVAGEGEDLQVVFNVGERKAEAGTGGRHPLFLVL